MPQYSYQGTSSDGQLVTGELSADSVSLALAELESRGLSVESISLSPLAERKQPAGAEGFGTSSLDGRFDAVMDRRDVLLPALVALAEDLPATPARRELRRFVARFGDTQSAAGLCRNKIAVQWLPLLLTGLTTESSARQVSDLVAQASRECQNRSHRRRMLAYPMLVLSIVLAVFVLLCAIVVPTFGGMFKEFGLILPTSTRVVVFVADQAQDHAIRFVVVIAVVLAAVYGLVRLWLHFAVTTRLFGGVIAGNSASVSAMSSLTGQLAELLSVDVSLPDALWIAGQGCRHDHFKSIAEELARQAHRGTLPLSESPIAHNLPRNLIHALQAGPDGGPCIPLLRELSAIYSDRVNQRVDWLTGAMAQFAMVAIGVAVAFIVIAVFSPLVSLVSSLS